MQVRAYRWLIILALIVLGVLALPTVDLARAQAPGANAKPPPKPADETDRTTRYGKRGPPPKQPEAVSYAYLLPRGFCTATIKAAMIAKLKGQVPAVEKVAAEARDYVPAMLARIEAERLADEEAGYAADRATLEEFEAKLLPLLAEYFPRELALAIDKAEKTPILDCGTPETLRRQRPEPPPSTLPVPPARLCTAAEKERVLEAMRQVLAAGRRYRDALVKHLQFLNDNHFGAGIDPATDEMYAEEFRAVDKLLSDNEILQKKLDDEFDAFFNRPLDKCASQFPVPPRPPFDVIELGPDPRLCTEPARNEYLGKVLDPAIARANAAVGIANAHLSRLAALSGQASIAHAPIDEIAAINDEVRAYQRITAEKFAFAQTLAARRAAVAARKLDLCEPPAPGTTETPPPWPDIPAPPKLMTKGSPTRRPSAPMPRRTPGFATSSTRP